LIRTRSRASTSSSRSTPMVLKEPTLSTRCSGFKAVSRRPRQHRQGRQPRRLGPRQHPQRRLPRHLRLCLQRRLRKRRRPHRHRRLRRPRRRCPQRCPPVQIPPAEVRGPGSLVLCWPPARRWPGPPYLPAAASYMTPDLTTRPARRAPRGPARFIAGLALVAVTAACSSGGDDVTQVASTPTPTPTMTASPDLTEGYPSRFNPRQHRVKLEASRARTRCTSPESVCTPKSYPSTPTSSGYSSPHETPASPDGGVRALPLANRKDRR
jgi:hypothetical protein